MIQPRKGPLGLHFFNREFGLNCLIDEVIPPREEWSSAPRTLSIALCNSCDYSCPHCYSEKTPACLQSSDVLSWAIEFEQNGGQSIGFGGGEPTLYPDFPILCQNITSATGLSVTFTTHGHRMTEDMARKISGAVHFIRVSIGGLFEVYEKTHLRPFNKLIECLPVIRHTAPFGFSYLVTSETLQQLDVAAEFAVREGAREFLLLPLLSPTGEVLLSESSQETLAKWIEKNWKAYPVAVSISAALFISSPILPIADPRGPSYDFLHVDARARLRPTAFGGPMVSLAAHSRLMDAVQVLRQIHADA